MEEKNPGLFKHAMTYGAIIGLILVAYIVILYITGLSFNKALGFLQYVILIAGLFIGTKVYRDKNLQGFITYGQALGVGVLISVFVGIISVFFNYILIRYIDPELIEKQMAIIEETLQNSRFIPEDQIELAIERSRKNLTAWWTLPVGVISFAFFGLIISLITSAIIKKSPNPLA